MQAVRSASSTSSPIDVVEGRSMSRSVLTLAIACLVFVSQAAELDRITTSNLRELRWQPSQVVKERGRRLQQSVAGSSFANANNITSTIVNATRDGGFLVVRRTRSGTVLASRAL